MKNKLYFQELDSLRALAVIFVIIFHAELKIYNYTFLSGGFIGVDIFFVLSGYLIGKIIYEDLYLKKFNLIRFFERRARRINGPVIKALFSWAWDEFSERDCPSKVMKYKRNI